MEGLYAKEKAGSGPGLQAQIDSYCGLSLAAAAQPNTQQT